MTNGISEATSDILSECPVAGVEAVVLCGGSQIPIWLERLDSR
jgi:hypothetical protein